MIEPTLEWLEKVEDFVYFFFSFFFFITRYHPYRYTFIFIYNDISLRIL